MERTLDEIKNYIPLRQAAKEIGMSYDYLRRMAKAGELPTIKTNMMLVHPEDLGAWVLNRSGKKVGE